MAVDPTLPPDPASAGRLDVDARFLLANERTLLAWIRTALTLLTVGAGVLQFGDDVPGRRPLSLVLVALGALSAVVGGRRWLRADAALRTGTLPDTGRAPLVLAGLVAGLGLALALTALLS